MHFFTISFTGFRFRLLGVASWACAFLLSGSSSSFGAEVSLRVDYVEPGAIIFATDNPEIIFHDEFDLPPSDNPGYLEYTTERKDSFVREPQSGLPGGAMRALFDQGQVTVGTLKVVFGRRAFSLGRRMRNDETFTEIYWRVYVKHESNWQGNPAKLARATCLVDANWCQGFIAHVWGGKDDFLCIDPATGIRDSRVVSTHYNDFDHLSWLGCRNGETPVFNPAETGRWVCIESHIKLNTPGKADGVFELWVDGKREAAHDDLNWQGTWTDYGINAVFLENYWNAGSPKIQSRWFDDFVISTKPIGPLEAKRPVSIHRTHGGDPIPWEAEIAADPKGEFVLWRSSPIPGEATNVIVGRETGRFTEAAAGPDLPVGTGQTYWVKVRPTGSKEWSPWHSPFR